MANMWTVQLLVSAGWKSTKGIINVLPFQVCFFMCEGFWLLARSKLRKHHASNCCISFRKFVECNLSRFFFIVGFFIWVIDIYLFKWWDLIPRLWILKTNATRQRINFLIQLGSASTPSSTPTAKESPFFIKTFLH